MEITYEKVKEENKTVYKVLFAKRYLFKWRYLKRTITENTIDKALAKIIELTVIFDKHYKKMNSSFKKPQI